ncbi:MAG: isopeptide-forming domain-containing fimbrial protein [Oscillospiraceae bacterium]|nr:isopeptide-forming domain-containing fimbrial protein [Oscillospiraceae bacterium]
MKKMTRIAAIAAAMTLAACMAVPAMSFSASAAGTGSITISDSTGATHNTLSAFQIFTADLDAAKDLMVTGWGDGVDVAGLSAAIVADTDLNAAIGALTDDAAGAKAAAEKISALSSANADKLAKLITQNTAGDGTPAGATSGNTSIDGLDTGYYIVKDTSAAQKDNYTAYTLGILAVVNGETTTASPKMDFPSFDKQIGDINDTTNTAGTYTYDEAADHDIGDDVPFKLIATVPANIDQYDTYKLIFHDSLEDGVFTLDTDSVAVKYYGASDTTGTDVTAAFVQTNPGTENAAFTNPHGDKTENLTLTCDDIKAITGIAPAAGGRFEVSYTAKLTDNAKIGAPGNWNSAYLEYSNNPNVSGSGVTGNTGTSPEDSVVAFTYQAVVNKVDEKNAPLPGAEFKLEKKLKDGSTVECGCVKANADATFVFNGLDDGEYTLTETQTPGSGYVAVDPITFTITGGEVQTDGSEAIGTPSVSGTDFTAAKVYVLDGTTATEGTEAGAFDTTIINRKGVTLPTTGGAGTVLFAVVGAALAAGAGTIMVAKKRAKDEEEQ